MIYTSGDFNWLKNCEKQSKIIKYFTPSKFCVCVCVCVCVCLCLYKMVDISAETWNNAGVSVLRIHEDDDVNKTLLLLICISDISKGQGCANICDLIDKKIMRKCDVKKDE